MDLVKFPEHRYVVQQAMHDEAAEVVSEEKGEREEHARRDAPGTGGRGGVRQAHGGIDESTEMPLVDQDESKGRRHDQRVREIQPVVRSRGAVPPDLRSEILAPEFAPWPARGSG